MRHDKNKAALKDMCEEIKKIVPPEYTVYSIDTHFVFLKERKSHHIYIKFQKHSKFTPEDYFGMAKEKFGRLI